MNYTPEQIATFAQQAFAWLTITEENHVLEIRLNRPHKKNALDPVLLRELSFAMQYARTENSVRAVLFGAEGDVFCAGADLKAFMGATEEHKSTIPMPEGEVLIGELFRRLCKPCITLVEGNVFAGGFLFLAGSTHVIAAEGIRLGLPEVKRGLFPFQVMAALIEVIPARKVLDWCMRGYDLPVQTALEWGLVTQVEEAQNVRSAALALVKDILKNSPTAIRMGLEAFEKISRKEGEHAYLQGMLMKIIGTRDAREGIAAFREKREPQWTGE